jgi:2-amino-4-hydroxy-6-hydroxymethyldihydropteridine diphosphokinase
MDSAFHHGYLGVGANIGNRQLNVIAALKRLQLSPRFELLRSSRPYTSPAWGYTSQHGFINMVLEVRWVGHLEDLLSLCKQIEAEAGRPPSTGAEYADRTLDLDLLWFDAVELKTPRLTLPHPQAHKRAFVLLPWRELAPELELAGQPLAEWLAQVPAAERQATRPLQDMLPQA